MNGNVFRNPYIDGFEIPGSGTGTFLTEHVLEEFFIYPAIYVKEFGIHGVLATPNAYPLDRKTPQGRTSTFDSELGLSIRSVDIILPTLNGITYHTLFGMNDMGEHEFIAAQLRYNDNCIHTFGPGWSNPINTALLVQMSWAGKILQPYTR